MYVRDRTEETDGQSLPDSGTGGRIAVAVCEAFDIALRVDCLAVLIR